MSGAAVQGGAAVQRVAAAEAGAGRAPLPAPDVQALWFATRRRDWTTLVVVPSDPESSAVPIAQALVDAGSLLRRAPIRLVRSESMGLDEIADLALDMRSQTGVWTASSASRSAPGAPSGQAAALTVVALESVVKNPLGIPVAYASDGVLLCLELRKSTIEGARRTIELIGKDHFIGCVLVNPG